MPFSFWNNLVIDIHFIAFIWVINTLNFSEIGFIMDNNNRVQTDTFGSYFLDYNFFSRFG